jgi:DNA-binding transcriptional ArsR family regulator
MATLDVLLHPIRLRILRTLLGGRQLTSADIAKEVGKVPVSHLYRHLNILLDAQVLDVVAERRVRGAVERTYVLRGASQTPSAGELDQMTADDHRRAFTAFVAGLLATFDQYVSEGAPDLARDGVGYSMNAFWLTDAEYADFIADVARIVDPRAKLGPGLGRQRRLVASAFIPLATLATES